jgi:hypothetical protein
MTTALTFLRAELKCRRRHEADDAMAGRYTILIGNIGSLLERPDDMPLRCLTLRHADELSAALRARGSAST